MWWIKSKNCGSCRGCGGHFWKNCAGVGVVIFGKILLGLGLGLSIIDLFRKELCCGGGVHFYKIVVMVGVVVTSL